MCRYAVPVKPVFLRKWQGNTLRVCTDERPDILFRCGFPDCGVFLCCGRMRFDRDGAAAEERVLSLQGELERLSADHRALQSKMQGMECVNAGEASGVERILREREQELTADLVQTKAALSVCERQVVLCMHILQATLFTIGHSSKYSEVEQNWRWRCAHAFLE